MRGYYVDPDQAFEEDASGFYHTTLSEQARNEVFGWGNNGSGVLELRGYVHANGHQVGEASASQTIELKRLTLQVESLQITDQANGEVTANLVDVLPGDIVTTGGGTIDTAQTARNLAQRVYAGFAALSANAQANVVAYVQGQIQTVIDSPYFTTLTQVSLYNHIDVSDLVTGDEQLITDYAYQAIGGDEGLPGGVVSRHVVRAGESLQSIAAAYYGSPSYWYLIAEANGLEGTEELKAGTTLSIPNAVANSVNDKESYKVYSESEIIGSTSPEVRVKQKKKKWYQKLVMVIIAVIVVVVAVYTGYIATELVATYGAVAGTVAAAAVGYAAGVATSAVTQGLAIAVDLQEEFDWKAAREMGQDFAITAVAAGATSAIGKANTLGKVLARGAVQMGRQYAESGKVTNWSGVALAMVGQSGVSTTSNWSSTVSFVNKHRNLLSSGLSVVEKFARGKDVNTLDWTNVAASAIGGQGSVTSVYSQADGINWGEVAKQSLISGGLSLAVGHRFGEAAGLNFFGNQLGAMVGSALVDKARAVRESTRVMNAETVVQITENASPYERQAQLNQQAEARKSAEQTEAQAIVDEQQRDRNWMLDAPDEGRNGANPSDDRLTITTEVDGLSIGEGLSQTTPVTDNGVDQTYAATPPAEIELIPLNQTPQTAESSSADGGERLGALSDRTDQNQSPLPDVSADLEVNVNLDFLHPSGPSSRAESLQMMDHGLMDAQRQEQLNNIAPIMGPINDWWEGVKERGSLLVADPLEATAQGFFNTYSFNEHITEEKALQALNRAQEGGGNLDQEALNELAGSLPLSGFAGITKRVFNKAPNSALHSRHVDELATLNRQGLLDELGQSGVKHTPENIIDIRKTQDGQIVFLETGNRQAGLEHILVRHEQDFANVGIHADQIPDAVMTAVTQGKVIGYQGKNQGRTIYETVFNDTRHRISVTVSDNGFIVGANPQSRLSPYITE
ncbi:MAG: LysM peptidoglycan-binding domain-containing protein [Candidatus Thiodiazotropha endolucinida]